MTNKRYTLFLMSPRQRFINYPAHTELAKMFGKRRFMVPLALPTVAALTPDHYNIHIYDEEIEEIPTHIQPDIVGITTLAATANRAFELGDRYRNLGVKVIYGGPYASFQIEKALEHGDAVVVGEAEEKWEQLLEDFEQEKMQQVYKTNSFVEYKTQKSPRWDLVNMKRIFQVAIQVSRGCPFNCDFCLVSKIFGRKMRYREIDNVVEEIKAAPSKYFFFVDDNLTINKRYAKELMVEIQPLKISWGCMCSIDVANDDELLKAMADAGCFNILIGFESLNPDSLDASNKHHNRRGTIYEEAIQRIHSHGLHINASFVVGFDSDSLEEFDQIYDFTLQHYLPHVNLHLLNAPPGSEIYQRYREEGRLMNCNPELGVGHFPTIHYMNMSQIELFDKYMATIERLYSFETVLRKAKNLFNSGNFTRPGGEISTRMKARLSWITLKEFLFTTDQKKRKLFFYIIGMIRVHKIAIDKGLGFLLTMLGYNRHIRDHKRNMDSYRKMIIQQDQGPWKLNADDADKTRIPAN
ncbi:MAG: B12-binding domain-containing radical SAM protein [Bacteroidales bacterium]|nr:B12-binding domain-containing radical SAM protein [Bacteroidales bacterium]